MMSRLSVLFLLAGAALAQPSGHALFAPIGVDLDSGPLSNPGVAAVTAWSEIVHVPGANSLQIRFDRAELGSESDTIEVTNPLDGERMVLTQVVLKQWQNHSAYFNGDTLQVRVVLSPNSSGHVAIGTVYSGIPRPGLAGPSPDNLCGASDDRTPLGDDRVCRMMRNNTTTSGGCTGWLIGNTNTFASAGTCANPFPDFLVIAEFNVPASTSSGAVQHPPVADQYPVHQDSVQFEDAGLGNDWAVGRLHPNSAGQTAVSRQGVGFTLASGAPPLAPPAFVPIIRVTGYGADFNNATRSYTQQSHTGPMVLASNVNHFAYQVDTEGGNAGSPIIVETSGEVIGIHTNGGCGNAFGLPTGSNRGTSILNPDVVNALAQVRGNSTLTMTRGTSYAIGSTATSTLFNYPSLAGAWNVIAVTSTSDWDIESETSAGSNVRVASEISGNNAEVLVANGHLGTVDPINGRIFRFAGTQGAQAQGKAAETISIGTAAVATLTSTTVVEAFQFNVTTAGNYDITVTGDPSWRWRLMVPGADADWRSWIPGSLLAFNVGTLPINSVALGTGWHVIVVTRNGGVATPAPSDLLVSVCPAAPPVAVTTTPVAISNPCQRFTVNPSAGNWYGVALASSSLWTTAIGAARSSDFTSFVLANGNLGAITPTLGVFHRDGAGAGGTAQALQVAGGIPINAPISRTILAGEVAQLYTFNITAAGAYDISVSAPGVSGAFYRVFAPGNSSGWIDRGDQLGVAQPIDAGFLTLTLGTGIHALVVYRNGAPFDTNTPIALRVCNSAPLILLNQNSAGVTFTETCRRFLLSPLASRWNLVGTTSASSSYALQIGGASSAEASTDADYLIANGHNGTVTPVGGTVTTISGSGSGVVHHAAIATVNPGATSIVSWGSGATFALFEFTVSAAGSYDITVTDVNNVWTSSVGPWWRLHTNDGTAHWQPRSTSNGPGASVASDTTRTVALPAGVHCLVLYRDHGPETVPGTIFIDFAQTPNPMPVLTAISPANTLVGSGNTVVTLTGSNFIPGSMARLNGVNLATSFNSATSLTAVIPAGQLTAIGTRDLTVFNPAPGGGTSGIQVFSVRNPAPSLTSITPNFAVANGGSQVITLNGSNFNGTSTARWNGAAIVTVFVSATQLIATIPAGTLVTPGTLGAVTVFNPAPGGGSSATQNFTVRFPVPTVTTIAPTSRIAGQAGGFTLDVNGSNFAHGASEIVFNGNPLTTTFQSPTLVRATVPAALVASAGSFPVLVRNPAPGGGNSNSVDFTVNGPTLSAISPNLVPVQAFGASVVITVNGTNFHSGSVVYANSDALPTVFISSTVLSATISSLAQPALRTNSALVLSVRNSAQAFSNFGILQIGGSNNRGIIARGPVAPAPGEAYAVEMDGGAAGSLFTMILDFAPVTATSTYPFFNAAANYSLNVRPFNPGTGDWFALLDGFGLHGPANPAAAYDAAGRFSLPGLAVPNPLLGLDLSVQAVFLDPTVPVGYRMTWVRHADRL